MSIYDITESCYKNRPDSHGLEHAYTVRNSALRMCEDLKADSHFRRNVEIVALLHDAFDKKYKDRAENEKLVRDFLFENEYPVEDIIKIIDHISYSKEKELGTRAEMIKKVGEDNILIRDVVSDADKLESLGYTGFERCKKYIKETNQNISRHNLGELLKTHANEKLFQLNCGSIILDKNIKLARVLENDLYEFIKREYGYFVREK